MRSSLDRGVWTRFQIDAEVDVFGVGRIVDRYNALREAALEYVTDSYRPKPKYDAERFDVCLKSGEHWRSASRRKELATKLTRCRRLRCIALLSVF